MERRSSSSSSRRPRVVSIPVHFIQSEQTQFASALKIQKAFRGFLVRKSVMQIKTILREVEEIERRIEAVKVTGRIHEKERLRLNETLMSLLLKLDSVRGICNGVRDCRKRVIKKAVALQEKVDSISTATETIAVQEMLPDVDRVKVDPAAASDPEEVATEGSVKTIELVGTTEQDQVVSKEEKKKHSLMENVDSSGSVTAIASDDQVAMEEEEEEPKTIHCLVPERNGRSDDGTNPEDESEEMKRERKRSREYYLLERMAAEKEKLVAMMKEVNEKNEIQMRLLNSLAQRVEMLEKTVVCDKLARMKKKKRHGGGGNNDNYYF